MKTKQIFLTLTFLTLSLINRAQDKYEFMIIEFEPTRKNEISISIDGKEFISEKADFGTTEKSHQNATPLLKKVNEYQDKGWELIDFNYFYAVNTEVFLAYMKKKKPEKK